MASQMPSSRLWRLHFMKAMDQFRKEGVFVDFDFEYKDQTYKVHSIIVAAFLPNINILTKRYSLPHSDIEWDGFVDSIYDLNSVTPKFYQSCLQPLARLLKIKFFCDVRYSILKDRFLLQEHLVTLWLNAIFSHLEKAYSNSYLCDCLLNINGEKLNIHKCVLAAVSPFFESMFTLDMLESKTSEIDLHGISSAAMKKTLKFVYSGHNILTPANVEGILTLSCYLQITNLQEKCEKYVIRNMDSENAIGILRLGKVCDSKYLYNRSLDFILSNISHIAQSEEFMDLGTLDIKTFLENKSVNIKDMEMLFDSLLSWFSSGNKTSKDLCLLLNTFNLCELESSKLSAVLRDNKCLQKAPECQALIKKTLLMKAENNEVKVSKRKMAALLVIRASCYSAGLHATAFSLETKKWFELSCLPKYDAGNGFAACADNNNIYVCGGSGNYYGMCFYNMELNRWKIEKNMTNERSDHVLCNVGSKLFVFGGRNHTLAVISAIESCDTESFHWRTVGDLIHPVFGATGVSVGHQVYLFGGCLSFSDYTDIIQCFDAKTFAAYVISRLPTQCSFGSVTAYEDEIFIVGHRGHVVKYDGDSSPELLGNIHTSSCMGFSAIKYKNQIWVLGGYGSTNESLEVKAFDLRNHRSSVLKKMTMPWSRMSNQYFSCIIYIDANHLTQEISARS